MHSVFPVTAGLVSSYGPRPGKQSDESTIIYSFKMLGDKLCRGKCGSLEACYRSDHHGASNLCSPRSLKSQQSRIPHWPFCDRVSTLDQALPFTSRHPAFFIKPGELHMGPGLVSKNECLASSTWAQTKFHLHSGCQQYLT